MPAYKQLTVKNVLTDIALTLVLGTLQVFGILALLFSSYGFLTCGNLYLNEWINIRNGFCVGSVILCFEILGSYAFFKARTKVFAISCWIITAGALFPCIVLGIDTCNRSHYYQDFDAEIWKSNKEKPLSMVRTFFDDKRYIGKTREEVIKDLGEGGETHRISPVDGLYYETDGFESPLIVEFKDGRVVSHYLVCTE